MAGPGMVPSAPSSKPALRAQFLTSEVLACHCEPAISVPELTRPGQPDGLGHEVGGALRSLDCQFREHGAGKLLHGASGPLALELAHGLGEFVQAEDAHRVIEQAQLGARWM